MSRPEKRRVNRKALLILMVAVAALAGTIHLVHGFQIRRNAPALLDQASQQEQEGQLVQAADTLSQYLGLMPSDTDALARYGLLLERLAKTGKERLQAFLVLEKVLRSDGERQDVRLRTVHLALAIGRFRDAREHLDRLMEKGKSAELLRLQARCAVGTRELDKAAELFEQAENLSRANVELYMEHALLLRGRLKDPDGADGVMERLIQHNEMLPAARLAAARYYLRFGPLANAAKQIQAALKLAPDDLDTLLVAAEVARAQRQIPQARVYLERGLKAHPDEVRLGQALARLEVQDGHADKARQYLQVQKQALPTDPVELWRLGDLLTDAGDRAGAEEVIKQLRTLRALAAADHLEARGLMSREAWAEARTLLEQARGGSDRLPDLSRRVNLLLAECFGRLGNPDERVKACQHALQPDPLWQPGRLALAAAWTAAGKIDQAVLEYRKLALLAPELRFELARLLLEQNRRLPPASQHWQELEQLLQDMGKDPLRALEVHMLQAQVLLVQGKTDAAREVLEAEQERSPKEVAPWLLLAELAYRDKKKEKILPLLDEAERRVGKGVTWELARIAYWARAGQDEARKQLPKIEARLGDYSAEEQSALRARLAGVYAAIGEPKTAERLWKKVLEHQPGSLGIRFLLFERAVATEREAEAEQQLEQMIKIEGGKGPYTLYGQAARLFAPARKGDAKALSEAQRLLREAAALRPSWSRVLLLQGQLDELEKRKDRALEHYQKALELGEGRLTVVRRVMQLLAEMGRFDEASALMHRLPDTALETPEFSRLAVGLTLEKEGHEAGDVGVQGRARALELARKAVASDSKNANDYLWLGQVALIAGESREAEKAFRQACALSPEAPETWVALVVTLARSAPERAEAALREAKQKLPADRAAAALAVCYEALGRMKEAEEQHQASLAARPNDPAVLRQVASFYGRVQQPAKVEPLVRRLMEPETKAPETTVAWARRILALTLTSRGTYAHFKEALALLPEESKERAQDVEDRRIRALVLASQPVHRREAIAILEGLPRDRGVSHPEVPLRLFQLYEAEGSWSKARQHLLTLIAADGKNPVYLAHYVRALLRHKETDEASEWLERLVKEAPKALETLELRVRVLHACGKDDEANRLMLEYAGKKEARLDLAAALLSEIGQSVEAEKLFRAFAEQTREPGRILLLAQYLGRHGKIAEALDLCEKVGDKLPPETVARVCLVAARDASAEQRKRVEHWIKAAIDKRPISRALLLFLAELQGLRSQYADQIQLYQRVVHQEPRNVIALNNLAYLLAVKEGKCAEALEMMQTVIDEAGPQAELLDTRALIQIKAGRAEAAIKDLQNAIAQSATPLMYFHLSQARLLAKDLAEARTAYKKAVARGLREEAVPELERMDHRQLTSELELER